MLKHAKLATRLGLSFGIVLLLTLALGLTGFFGFDNVVRKVKQSDQAGALIQHIQQAREYEQAFITASDKEAEDKLAQEMRSLIRETETFQSELRTDEDKGAMEEIKSQARLYQQTFLGYVDLVRDKEAAQAVMVDSARTLQETATSIKKASRTDLRDSQRQSQKRMQQSQAGSKAAQNLVSLLFACRKLESEYLKNGSLETAEAIQAHIQQMDRLSRDLSAGFQDQDDQGKAQRLIQSIAEYEQGFQTYQNIESEREAALQAMDQASQDVVKTAADIRMLQRASLTFLLIDDGGTAQIKDSVAKMQSCNAIGQFAGLARQNEKDFLLTGNAEFAKAARTAANRIVSTAAGLQSKLQQQLSALDDPS